MPGIVNSAEKIISNAITAPAGATPLVLAGLKADNIIHIATSDREMRGILDSLKFFAPDVQVLEFPAWDSLPYDRSSPNPAIVSSRVNTLTKLAYGLQRKTIIVTTANAVLQKIPAPKIFKESAILVEKGKTLPREDLIKALIKNGYGRVSKVVENGEYAVRGSIIDLLPSGAIDGIRIDFFGDEVETIKEFDVLTQVTSGEIPRLQLLPASEIIFDAESIERFRSNYRKIFGAVVKEDLFYESISSGAKYPGQENWLPLFYTELATIFDYLPGAVITQSHITEHAFEERIELIHDYYDARKGTDYKPLPPEMFYELHPKYDALTITPFAANEETAYKSIKQYGIGGAENIDKLKSLPKKLFISAFTQGSLEHIKTLLKKHDISAKQIESWNPSTQNRTPNTELFVAPIEEGFEGKDFIVISEQDIFGDRFIRTQKKRRKAESFLAEAAGIEMDELIVHESHGIGRFAGLETVEVNGKSHAMAKLLYDGGDRLFVPVENFDVISRYGGEAENARLDKLGGVQWQERKAKLKERIKLAADALLKIAAERALKSAPKLMPDVGMYDEFVSRFPYSETEDQLRSIEDVFADLASGKPMDRLICGDVGFGKTEVALRAAFMATQNSKQVAVVCPTTLLARQHYKTFTERFKGFPLKVAQLSRMVSAADAKKAREGLADGTVDVVVGTHALLADSIKFKDLGLVVVDEEQHFGVIQKEKLKNLRAEVHVLTLSATPIPRSLQMAMSGVRDLSIIATPPVDRLAVRTFVMPFDELVIREAILREHNRGGRTYYVAPRIADLEQLYPKLQKLVPEVKFKVAHGKTTPAELDKVMNQFYDGVFDVLLSTAIVESGLDIPTANTMIIHRADMFGLSQLYQLRGRVGRSKTRAYAYFTTEPRRFITDNAGRRLEVIQGLDSLGAGFAVASHDMDIRGFGNLLGDEQSGHVREVGIELYQKMLQEAILRARAEGSVQKSESYSPSINIGTSVLIPETYVADLDLRLSLYKRAAGMENEEDLSAFAVEVTDRFGRPPSEVLALLEVIRLKILCRKAGVEKIDVGPKAVVMQFHASANIDPARLMLYVQKNTQRIKIRPDNKLVFTKDESEDFETNVRVVESYLNDIIKLSAKN